MKAIELTDLLIGYAKEYRLQCRASLLRNNHMHDAYPDNIRQTQVDAILVDYINFIANKHCMDLGLYTKDLTDVQTDKIFK